MPARAVLPRRGAVPATIPFALAALGLLLALPTAVSDHWCAENVYPVSLPGRDVAYIVFDPDALLWNQLDLWIYAETNWIPGLQRGGAGLVGGVIDYCQTSYPDTLIF